MRCPIPLLCFVALAALADATPIKSLLRNRESNAGRLMREGHFAKYRELRAAHRDSRFGRGAGIAASGKQPVAVDSDITYTVNVSIGTPPQYFVVAVDTTWSSFWVPDVNFHPSGSDCAGGVCYDLDHFDPTKSSTYYSPGPIFTPPAGDSPIIGNIGFDYVGLGDAQLGQVRVPNGTVGMITELHNQYQLEYDGLLGLGLYVDPNTPEVKPVFKSAVDAGVVDQPVFSIWLQNTGEAAAGGNGGQITFGSVDDEHCSSDILYTPTNDDNYWRFAIDGVAVNDLKTLHAWNAISDSGSQINYVPIGVLDDLTRSTNATYDFDTGLYRVDCTAKFTWSVIVGDKQLDTDETTGIIKFGDTCYLGFESWDSEWGFDVVLGDLFIRSWCQIYDLRGKIGFAKVVGSS